MDSLSKTELLKRLQESQEQIARLVQENALLRQKIDLLVRRIFGASSEKLDAAQLELLLALGTDEPGKVPASSNLEEALPASSRDPSRRRRKNEPRWPADLPVIEEVIEPPQVQIQPPRRRRGIAGAGGRASKPGAASARKSANNSTMNRPAFCAGG